MDFMYFYPTQPNTVSPSYSILKHTTNDDVNVIGLVVGIKHTNDV